MGITCNLIKAHFSIVLLCSSSLSIYTSLAVADVVIRGVFGAVWALPRLLEANIGEVQLGRYRALWANPGLDHMGIT